MFMFIPGTCIQHCREPRNISYNMFNVYVYCSISKHLCSCLCVYVQFIQGTCIQHCREPRNISYNCLCLCLFQEPVYNIVGNQEI